MPPEKHNFRLIILFCGMPKNHTCFIYKDEIIRQKIGFVKYEISDEQEFLVNGIPVKIKGVNHHDTDPEKGWTMSVEDIKKDLHLMKKT